MCPANNYLILVFRQYLLLAPQAARRTFTLQLPQSEKSPHRPKLPSLLTQVCNWNVLQDLDCPKKL